VLRCEECGKEESHDWRAYLTVVDEDEPEEVVVYCPDCAKREFGEGRRLT
jgi:DNA-directed RNA polymerase subunit N (RpoN/RPB10)